MVITKLYTVDRIVDGEKIVLLDRENETIQVVVNIVDFPPVSEGDILKVTWTKEVGGVAYVIKLEEETQTTRERLRAKRERLRRKYEDS